MHTADTSQLRTLVADVLVAHGILERARARMNFNYLVTAVVEQLPDMQTEAQTREMLQMAVRWYFQDNRFSAVTLTRAARQLWDQLQARCTVGRSDESSTSRAQGILQELEV